MPTPRHIHAELIIDLTRRADGMEAAGDHLQASHVRRQVEELKLANEFERGNIISRYRHPSAFDAQINSAHRHSLASNLEQVVDFWGRLTKPTAIYIPGIDDNIAALAPNDMRTILSQRASTAQSIHMSFGDQGSVTFTPSSFIFTGNATSNPEILLAGMLHIKHQWGRYQYIGPTNEEFHFKFAVAAEMLQVPIANYTIPLHRRIEADAIKVQWQSTLDRLNGLGSPMAQQAAAQSASQSTSAPQRPNSNSARPTQTSANAHSG